MTATWNASFSKPQIEPDSRMPLRLSWGLSELKPTSSWTSKSVNKPRCRVLKHLIHNGWEFSKKIKKWRPWLQFIESILIEQKLWKPHPVFQVTFSFLCLSESVAESVNGKLQGSAFSFKILNLSCEVIISLLQDLCLKSINQSRQNVSC